MESRSVAIRCETRIDSGFGHMSRMATLARTLENRHRAGIKFLCDRNPIVERALASEGFRYQVKEPGVSEEDFVERETTSSDIVVMDTKRDYSVAFVRLLRASRAVVFVDHCGPGAFAADLVIFPCAALSRDVIEDPRWTEGGAVLLHGPQFVLLGRHVLELGQHRGIRGNGGPLVVTTGGRDPEGVLVTVLTWLARVQTDRSIIALVGEAFAHHSGLERLIKQLPAHVRVVPFSYSQLLEAQIAICTFGVTAYELMFLGIPSLVIGHSRENASTSRILAERCRATVDLGFIGELTEHAFLTQLSSVLEDQNQRLEMSRSAVTHIDGLGGERMAQAILGLGA
jgi:spore coat polysaccharide biosynthesis predicted glycosyltransferase SpsG